MLGSFLRRVMISLNEESLKVVKGKPNSGIIVVPLKDILAVESRIPEIAFVTPHKAPELLAAFNVAYLELDKHLKVVEMEVVTAKQNQSVIKATVLLDKCEEVFKTKGIKPSADLRQAIVDLDPDYRAATERVNALEAASEYLSGKIKVIEMAFGSVKKIIGEGTYNHKQNYGNINDQEVRNNFGKTF
jgi:hypothetical protein